MKYCWKFKIENTLNSIDIYTLFSSTFGFLPQHEIWKKFLDESISLLYCHWYYYNSKDRVDDLNYLREESKHINEKWIYNNSESLLSTNFQEYYNCCSYTFSSGHIITVRYSLINLLGIESSPETYTPFAEIRPPFGERRIIILINPKQKFYIFSLYNGQNFIKQYKRTISRSR